MGHRRRRDRHRAARRAQRRRRAGGGEALASRSRSSTSRRRCCSSSSASPSSSAPRRWSRTCTGASRRPGRTSRSRSRSRCSPTPESRPFPTSPRRRATRRGPFRTHTSSSRAPSSRSTSRSRSSRCPRCPCEEIDGELTTLLALPPEEGGYANDPILGVVENLGLEGFTLRRGRDLRRRARGDDPLHRDERGRHRRLADHVLDGELPPAPRGAPAAAPALQDPVALARPLRRDRADPRDPPGRRQLRRARCTRSGRRSRSRSRTSRSSRLRMLDRDEPSSLYRARPNLAVARCRRGRSSPSSARSRHGASFLVLVVQNQTTRWRGARLDGARPRRLRRLSQALRARLAARDREGAARVRPCAGARVPAAPRAGDPGPAVGRGHGRRLPARRGARLADRRPERARGSARPAAHARTSPSSRRRRTESSTRRPRSATRTAFASSPGSSARARQGPRSSPRPTRATPRSSSSARHGAA